MNRPNTVDRDFRTPEHSEFFHDNMRDFEELIDSDYTRGIIKRIQGGLRVDDASMEDMVHETFIKIMGKLEEKRMHNMPQYFATILRRLCIDRFRKLKNHPVEPLDETVISVRTPEPDPLLQNTIEQRIQELSAVKREAILLFIVEGLTSKEIARIVNTSIGTVGTRVKYGREELRNLLEAAKGDYGIAA